MSAPYCPVHQVAFVLRPAGVSKKSGKPYEAFYSCPNYPCDSKAVSESKAQIISEAKSDQEHINENRGIVDNFETAKPVASYGSSKPINQNGARIERQHSQSVAREVLHDLIELNLLEVKDSGEYLKALKKLTNTFQNDVNQIPSQTESD